MKQSKIRFFSIMTYIMLLVINTFMLFFLRNYFNLMFLAALIIAPFFSFIIGFFLCRTVQFSLNSASLVENRHNEFQFSVHVDNPSILFTNNCVVFITVSNELFGEKTTHSINIPINPFMESKVIYPVKSAHCGVISISVNSVVIFDIFNLFRFHKNINVTREIPVFPDESIIDNTFTMDFSQGCNNMDESTIKGNDTSEVSEIREYIPGDKLQNIHWKLSAKKDILMVKERMSLTSTQLLFYIELADLENEALDTVLDYAYGIGTFLCTENKPFTFLWYSVKRQECRSHFILNLDDLRECLCEILYESPFANYKELRSQIPLMCGHENFITIGADYVLEKEKQSE